MPDVLLSELLLNDTGSVSLGKSARSLHYQLLKKPKNCVYMVPDLSGNLLNRFICFATYVCASRD
jgi:hypothetical protein